MNTKSSIHKAFKLQGKSVSSEGELMKLANSIDAEVASFLKEWFNTHDFIKVKTSGSTGTPNEIKLKKQHMINSALATGDYFNLHESTTALLCMSPSYIAGKMMLVRALTLGWCLDITSPSLNPLEKSNKSYDFCAMVPLQVANSLNNLERIKKLIIGGGAVSNQLLDEIRNIKTEVFATYGMTETCTHIAVKKLNNFYSVIASEAKQSVKKDIRFPSKIEIDDFIGHTELVSSSHYQILPNIKISIDKRDCLLIDALKVSDSRIITNDIVELISETEFKWLGRYDNIINSGGIKISPEQVENKLADVVSGRFFVAGVPDEKLGEKVVLLVENCSDNSILEKIKKSKKISKYETPKNVFYLKKLVETPSNKIDRNASLKLIKGIC